MFPIFFPVPFRLDTFSGWLYTSETLDTEATSKYIFPVSVLDAGMPPLYANITVEVIVTDVNDNPPVFGRTIYEGTIVENDRNVKDNQEVLMVIIRFQNSSAF